MTMQSAARLAMTLGTLAIATLTLSCAEAQQRGGTGDIRPLPRELQTVFDCRGEVALVSYYWDRIPERAGGGKTDPAVIRPLIAAYQAGNIAECHRQVIEVRRYLGLL